MFGGRRVDTTVAVDKLASKEQALARLLASFFTMYNNNKEQFNGPAAVNLLKNMTKCWNEMYNALKQINSEWVRNRKAYEKLVKNSEPVVEQVRIRPAGILSSFRKERKVSFQDYYGGALDLAKQIVRLGLEVRRVYSMKDPYGSSPEQTRYYSLATRTRIDEAFKRLNRLKRNYIQFFINEQRKSATKYLRSNKAHVEMDTRVDNFQPEAADLLEDSYLDQKYNPGKFNDAYGDDDLDIPVAPESETPGYFPIKEEDKLLYSGAGRSPAPVKKSWWPSTTAKVPPSSTPSSSTQMVPYNPSKKSGESRQFAESQVIMKAIQDQAIRLKDIENRLGRLQVKSS